MRTAIAVMMGYLLALGAFTAIGLRSVEQEAEKRCDALIRGYELLGDELEAPPEQVERFVTRLRDATDC